MTETVMTELDEKTVSSLFSRLGIGEWRLVRQFFSKRNRVFLLEAGAGVAKQHDFDSTEAMMEELTSMGLFAADKCACGCEGCAGCDEQDCLPDGTLPQYYVWKQYKVGEPSYEAKMLKLLKEQGVCVPDIIAEEENGLLLQYIEGQNLCRFLEKEEAAKGDGLPVAELLAQWLCRYYQATGGKSRGDINLRNFIIEERTSRLFSLDFEDVGLSDPAHDIASILVYVLNYEPVFTHWKQRWVKQAAQLFCERLQLDAGLLRRSFCDSLDELCSRRSVQAPQKMYALLD